MRTDSLPLDVAADGGLLVVGGFLAGEEGVEGGADVLAGDGLVVAGARVVELAAVNEFLA